MEFSTQEKALLRELQRDNSRNLAEIAEFVGMAQSTVWRKVQEFEASGVIAKRVALLDPTKTGAKLCVLASITLSDHSEAAIAALTSLVRSHPEILECHAVSGAADYVMKIRTQDVESYEAFMSHNLLRNPSIRAVTSSFVLKDIKSTTELPL